MELFNTKLNRGYVFAHGEPGCEGMTVIPPGNLMSSKEDGWPKSDGVNDRFTCWSIISIKDDLSMANLLKHLLDQEEHRKQHLWSI